MSDLISVDDKEAKKVALQFEQEAERVQRVFKQLQGDIDILKKGGWIADAADVYYQKMDGEVMPGVNRLSRALNNACDTTHRLMELFVRADEEACQHLRGK